MIRTRQLWSEVRCFESITVSPCQPALAVQRTPTVDVQNWITTVEEKCTPDLPPTIRILLHQGSVASNTFPDVPQQEDPANNWGVSKAFAPGENVNPGDDGIAKAFNKLATRVRISSAK